MNKAKKILLYVFLGVTLVALGWWCENKYNTSLPDNNLPTTRYGAFLASQHAVYVNDFASASGFCRVLTDVENSSVENLRIVADFLNGNLSADVSKFQDDKTMPMSIIYDVYLANNDKWGVLYNRHKNNSSGLFSAFRIWPGIASNHKTNVLKFIENTETSDDWKSFVRGQIYSELGDNKKALENFQKVNISFLNINDYLYLMSFYSHYGFSDQAVKLKQDFVSMPGGMYLTDFSDVPDWSVYSGYKNQMAFSLLQTVSHTQVISYSDLYLVLLRCAQIIAPTKNADVLGYYLGLFMFNNGGDFNKYFSSIKKSSPFYPFALTKAAEANKNVKDLENVLHVYPAFVPALQQIVNQYIGAGNKSGALKVINLALKQGGLNDKTRAFFTKVRANVYYVFGDYKRAQSDLRFVSDSIGVDGDILMLQAKIWAAQKREIETAYEYAMKLVTKNPTDVFAWDVLGRVVYVREGVDAALEIVQGVGAIANNCSALFENLGDLYNEIGDIDSALNAYERAIDLSSDGMVVVPNIEKKIRKLK